ncbi:MAG: PHP domain-containing protein [bacterium]|nr:PHP domain-containing protein [bacterium]
MHRYDLHTHSCASHDCATRYEDLIAMARRRGLNGIALTDHDTMDGYHHLVKVWPAAEMHLIPGCERTLFDGSHIIGLFIQSMPAATTLREAITEIRAQGGLVYLPHPYREYSGVLGAAAQHSDEDRAWAVEHADIIEIYNRKCTAEENSRALELAKKYKKSFAAGSDAHRRHEIGFGVTLLRERFDTRQFETLEAWGLAQRDAARETAHRTPSGHFSLRVALRAILQMIGLLTLARSLRNSWRRSRQPLLERYQ